MGRSEPGLAGRGPHRSRSWRGAAKGTMLGVIEAATRRLQVALPTLALGGLAVIDQGIEAGQAGAGSQEDGKKDERLSPTHAENIV